MTAKQIELLALVADYTKWQGDERPGRVLESFFVPQRGPMMSDTLGRALIIGGSGDARCFDSLVSKGFARRMRADEPYWLAVTEDGLLQLAMMLGVS